MTEQLSPLMQRFKDAGLLDATWKDIYTIELTREERDRLIFLIQCSLQLAYMFPNQEKINMAETLLRKLSHEEYVY